MRVLRELVLGARMALAGGVSGWTRAGLTALGVGLGVAMLLLAISVPHALAAQDARAAARGFAGDSPARLSATDATMLLGRADTAFGGRPILGHRLQPDGTHPPLPPGLASVPGPGQLVVSPALARLLASPRAALLRERLDFPVVGTIGPQGLSGPAELAFYLGVDDLDEDDPTVTRVVAFGSTPWRQGLDPVLTLLVVVIVVILLLPVALFVGAATRFGGEARDRRLAGVRLLGADARMTRRIAAGEALASSVLGLAVGAGLFLAVRSLVDRAEMFGYSAYPSDLRPDAMLAALVAVLVPLASVVVAQLSLRRVVIEPLGVTRRGGDARRRLWWRVLPPLLGAALLLPLRGAAVRPAAHVSPWQVSAGIVLILTGVAALLPWAVGALVRRLRGGPLAWQLAIRRLQTDASGSARAVMGIAVAVAGAIGLQMMFVSVQIGYVRDTALDPSLAYGYAYFDVRGGWSEIAATDAAVRAVPGVMDVHSRLSFPASYSPEPGSPQYGHGDFGTYIWLGDCPTLRQLAVIGSCADGDVFLVDVVNGPAFPTPGPGTTLRLDTWPGDSAATQTGDQPVSWTVPASVRTVAPKNDPMMGQLSEGLLVTPGALPADTGSGRMRPAQSTVYLDRADSDVDERLRTVLWRRYPAAFVGIATEHEESSQFAAVRRALFAGASLTIGLIGLGLLITVVDQLRERRRVLASLAALGTRRPTMAWSILWQAAVPVALGMVLAGAAGTGVGAILLRIIDQPVHVDWQIVWLVCAVAALAVLAVTALSIPVLWRLMRSGGLRTE